MTEERFQQMESRLGTLEQTVQMLKVRLAKLEPATSRAPVAPPVQASRPVYYSPPPPPPPSAAKARPDAEYQFGAQWLPRIGAALVVLGISYLIALAVRNGLITPPMLFAGAILLCAGFIGVGLLLRDEREDFGQVLTGIGSCGMFATFAGGHIYQNLYNGETMVGAFVLWGLANLGYAMWKASRSFLAIGIIGGFLGVVMPLSKDTYFVSLGLHAVIFAVSALVIYKHRFGAATFGLWVASMLSLSPIAFAQEVGWVVRVSIFELAGVLSAVTFVLGRRKADDASDGAIVGGLVVLSTLAAFSVKHDVNGSLHVLVVALVCGLIGLAFRSEKSIFRAWVWTGVSLATLLAPFGLQRVEAAFVFAGLSILAGLAASVWRFKELKVAAAFYLPLAAFLYVYLLSESPAPSSSVEIGLLSAILAGAAAMALALRRDDSDPSNLVALLASWGAVTRLSVLLFASPGDLKLTSFSVTVAWVGYGVLLLVIGFLADLRNWRYASLTVLFCAVGKVLLIDMATATPVLRVTVLIGVGLALVAGGYAYIKRRSTIAS